jgi:hypothetical protein
LNLPLSRFYWSNSDVNIIRNYLMLVKEVCIFFFYPTLLNLEIHGFTFIHSKANSINLEFENERKTDRGQDVEDLCGRIGVKTSNFMGMGL